VSELPVIECCTPLAGSSLSDERAADIEAVLTADWPLDRFGHGDISLRVPGDRWSEAEWHLSNLD
jgi:hypothetical protein